MAASNFGLDTLTRYPGFGYGWSNQDFATPSAFTRENTGSINMAYNFGAGDKVRVVARVKGGTAVKTSPESVRLRIRMMSRNTSSFRPGLILLPFPGDRSSDPRPC